MEDRHALRKNLSEVLQQQLRLIARLDSSVQEQLTAATLADMDKVNDLASQLAPLSEELEGCQLLVEELEVQVMVAYEQVSPREAQQEMANCLVLRQERDDRYQLLMEKQQALVFELTKHLNSLTAEGRRLLQTTEAYHSYRNAAQPTSQILSTRK